MNSVKVKAHKRKGKIVRAHTRTLHFTVKHPQALQETSSGYDKTNLPISEYKKALLKRLELEGKGFIVRVSSKGYAGITKNSSKKRSKKKGFKPSDGTYEEGRAMAKDAYWDRKHWS